MEPGAGSERSVRAKPRGILSSLCLLPAPARRAPQASGVVPRARQDGRFGEGLAPSFLPQPCLSGSGEAVRAHRLGFPCSSWLRAPRAEGPSEGGAGHGLGHDTPSLLSPAPGPPSLDCLLPDALEGGGGRRACRPFRRGGACWGWAPLAACTPERAGREVRLAVGGGVPAEESWARPPPSPGAGQAALGPGSEASSLSRKQGEHLMGRLPGAAPPQPSALRPPPVGCGGRSWCGPSGPGLR